MTPTDPAPLQLDEIKARADAATAGPWTTDGYYFETGDEEPPLATWVDGPTWWWEGHLPPNDAEFIAHAREDIPALIAEVERLRALVAEPGQARGERPRAVLQCSAVWVEGLRCDLPEGHTGAHETDFTFHR